ncbi:MAG: MFS transporter, partial [Candidatus Omnitrophica bacterium]|nr:MFS transporter [Candidatus Omnitrophota bacterium]
LLLVDHFLGTPQEAFYLSLSGILFVLPFLLFSTYSGFLADRFSKKTIIVVVKAVEMTIASLAIYGFSTSNVSIMLAVVFLMGTHSAFFGPAKYGIIPEMLPSSAIPEANGMMVLLTYVGIILGKVLGGSLAQFGGNQMGYVLLLTACVGFVSSLFIDNVKPSGSRRKFNANFIREIFENVHLIRKSRPIFLSIMGLSYFAFLGGLFELNILVYAKNMVLADKLHTSYLLICLAIGIGLGSFLAGKLSDQKVELGLVPLGAIGISFFSVALGFTYHSYTLVCINLLLLGGFCGFLIVPLNSLIQNDSPADQRGQILATNNFLSFSGILLGSGFLFVFRQFHLNPAQIFIVCGILTILGTIYACRLLPYPLVRLCVWILTHTIYRIKVIDKHHFPDEGGALVVSNHISFIDAVLIVVCVQRPVRFLMSREVYRVWWLSALCRLGRAIPIDRHDSPKEMIRALHTAKQAIKDGEVVCIFPEGQLTRTGNTLKFNEGMEHICKGVNASIVPVHLDRIWGSIFSWKGGRFFWKWPKIVPYPVTVSFGEPMPSQSTAFAVRNKILELGAQAFQYRTADKHPLAEKFLWQARKQPLQFCLADSSGLKFNYGLTAVSAVAVADYLKSRLAQSDKIGVLIPPSVSGAVVNIALGMLKKVPVNINYTSSKEAVESIVKQCEMRYCISSRLFLEKMGLQLTCEMVFIEDVIKSLNPLSKINAVVKSFFLPKFLTRKLIFGSLNPRNPEDLATIMFTSGSTGEPKGVMLTHSNITSNLEGLYQVFEVEKNDKILGVLPFFHSFGFTGTLWFPLIAGIGAVYHYNPLDAKVVGKLFAEHEASILMSTPTFLNSYIRRIEPQQFKTLRFVMVGAEKLKPQLAQEFQSKFNILPMEGYGCTELSPIVSVNMPDFTNEGVVQKAQKPGSIGLPLPGIAVKIVDPDSRQTLDVGQEGLLMVKGPNVMKGYLNASEKTAQVIADGWYQTGD